MVRDIWGSLEPFLFGASSWRVVRSFEMDSHRRSVRHIRRVGWGRQCGMVEMRSVVFSFVRKSLERWTHTRWRCARTCQKLHATTLPVLTCSDTHTCSLPTLLIRLYPQKLLQLIRLMRQIVGLTYPLYTWLSIHPDYAHFLPPRRRLLRQDSSLSEFTCLFHQATLGSHISDTIFLYQKKKTSLWAFPSLLGILLVICLSLISFRLWVFWGFGFSPLSYIMGRLGG